MRKNANKLGVLALFALLLFIFSSCENEPEKLRIRIGPQAIFVNNKKVANTADVEKRDTLLIEGLDHALRNKALENKEKNKRVNEKIEIQVDTNQSYDIPFKVITTVSMSGFTDISIASKINGKKYTEFIDSSERSGPHRIINPDDLELYVFIDEGHFEIWVRRHSFRILAVKPIDSVYDVFAKVLAIINSHFRGSSDVNKIMIIAYGDMKISNIIQAMHAAEVSGFTKKQLAIGYKGEEKYDVSRFEEEEKIMFARMKETGKSRQELMNKDAEDFVDKIKRDKDRYEASIKAHNARMDSMDKDFFKNLERVMDSLGAIIEMKK
jgi:biopolymer transport protein ExbD